MMTSLKDILGPIRSTKQERVAKSERLNHMKMAKSFAMKKYGPDKSILADFRKGNISRSSINKLPLRPFKSIVSDNVNVLKPKKDFLKTKSNDMGDYFR